MPAAHSATDASNRASSMEDGQPSLVDAGLKGRKRTVPIPRTIGARLLFAFAIPTLALFAAFAVLAYNTARGELESELGARLSAVAATAAEQIRGRYLVDLAAGDEEDRAYLNALRKLEAAAAAAGVARIYIFDADFIARVDTAAVAPIGTKLFQAELHRHELATVFRRGESVASVLFEGEDGQLYQAGYAPVRASDRDDDVVLALGVDAPATYFNRLLVLGQSLLLYGVLLIAVVMAVAVVVAGRIIRPLGMLAKAAERIGQGQLALPIEHMSQDEIGLLAETMDDMRRQLQARDQRMQLMLSGIAHEVRNPLGGIELFAGILRDELESDDERRAHVERIERELGYLKRVVTEFLEYARRPQPEMQSVNVAEVLRDVSELCLADAEEAGVRLNLQLESACCYGDAGQLRRVALNLLRNAIQASRAWGGGTAANVDVDGDGDNVAGPTVDIRLQNGEKYVEWAIVNRGEPIADEVRAHMFEPFFTTKEKGTGLGLAFAGEIIADHGGRIDVVCSEEPTEKNSPNVGALIEFRVHVPMAHEGR